MALKDDARALARDLTEVGAQLSGCAERLDQIADLIPTPEQARTFTVPEGFKLVQTKHTPVVGEKIGRRDMEGRKLRVGDDVQVYDSARYGNPRGTVIGPADTGDGKKRVEIRLDDGRDDHYAPSCERVERVQKGKDRPIVTASGRVLTDEDFERLADEAEEQLGAHRRAAMNAVFRRIEANETAGMAKDNGEDESPVGVVLVFGFDAATAFER